MQINTTLSLPQSDDKTSIIDQVRAYTDHLQIPVQKVDDAKPWGFEFYIEPYAIKHFCSLYFSQYSMDQIMQYGDQLQPKFLVVSPGGQLSWQYHYRRAELWSVVAGPVGLITSADDTLGDLQTLQATQTFAAAPLTRHRLVGLASWGVVAEIWQHTDPNQLSDTTDIVRVQDDYQR